MSQILDSKESDSANRLPYFYLYSVQIKTHSVIQHLQLNDVINV